MCLTSKNFLKNPFIIITTMIKFLISIQFHWKIKNQLSNWSWYSRTRISNKIKKEEMWIWSKCGMDSSLVWKIWWIKYHLKKFLPPWQSYFLNTGSELYQFLWKVSHYLFNLKKNDSWSHFSNCLWRFLLNVFFIAIWWLKV